MPLAADLLACAVPSTPNVLEAIVGDALNFTLPHSIASQTTTLTRRPSGSSAAIVSNACTVDVAGLYTITLSCAGFSRVFQFVCFPASVLTQKVSGAAGAPLVNRGHLRGAVNDQRFTPATLAASLEAVPSTLVGFHGGAVAPSWTQFA